MEIQIEKNIYNCFDVKKQIISSNGLGIYIGKSNNFLTIHTYHLVLAKENSPAGELYNEIAINYLI